MRPHRRSDRRKSRGAEPVRQLGRLGRDRSTVFLRAGLEPKQLRSRFVHDLEDAGRYLAILSEAAEASPSSRRAIRTISENLPRYSGLVELSRANNLQGELGGQLDLQDASDLMSDTIPARHDRAVPQHG